MSRRARHDWILSSLRLARRAALKPQPAAGLSRFYCRLRLEPLSGHLFLFRNRRGDRIKILVWDRSGFWVLYKRLERGTFAWPSEQQAEPLEMRGVDLMLLLLSGVDVGATRRRRWYDRAA